MTRTYAHPYQALPEYTRWRKAISLTPAHAVDPVVNFPFRIATDEKVATAGSCFAQHIARHLRQNNFNYYVAESAHPLLAFAPLVAAGYNYGTFSARYGNIYTSRQLLQLIQRALGHFSPAEGPWFTESGRVIDPFRPQIQPNGFVSEHEMMLDRTQHLARTRTMFETLDYFVFTLGLTEFWYSRADGAALPICPGVSGGTFDDARYGFANLSVDDVLQDMTEFLRLLRDINPHAKVILTVSPVPLAATAEPCHVLVSTTYSKSVLRVAAETLQQRNNFVAYFPSYEIITGNFNRGAYYDGSLRDVTEDGVSHVMRLFLKHATVVHSSVQASAQTGVPASDPLGALRRLQQVVETKCEEAAIEASLQAADLSDGAARNDAAKCTQ